MGNKITTQVLIESLAQSSGLNKKSVESFVRAFSESVVEGVTTDGNIKIKDLGTFKLVDVAERGSVDVNTGERIVIPGYKKLGFSQEDSFGDRLSMTDEAAASVSTPQFAVTVEKAAPKKKTTKKAKPVAEPVAPAEPAVVAEPVAPVEPTVVAEPVAPAEPTVVAEPVVPVEPAVVAESVAPVEPAKPTVAFETVASMEPGMKPANMWMWIAIGVIALLVVVVICFCYIFCFGGKEVENNDNTIVASPVEKTEVKRTVIENPQPGEQPRKKVHILTKGESLTTISVLYYHTKDSMFAIWRLNGFEDPNNIPLGTEIKLP